MLFKTWDTPAHGVQADSNACVSALNGGERQCTEGELVRALRNLAPHEEASPRLDREAPQDPTMARQARHFTTC